MKKILLLLFAGMYIVSCNETSTKGATMSSQAEKNLEASRLVSKAFETGDASLIDSVVAPNFVDHTERGDLVGRDSLKAMVVQARAAFPDMKTEVIKEFADDEYVYMHNRYTGTSDGKMIPKGPFTMRTIEVTRFENGKIVEHWAYAEMADIMKMMAPPMDNVKPDTTKAK